MDNEISVLKEKLAAMYDAVDLQDMLEIDNEELLDRFTDRVIERYNTLLLEVEGFE